MRTSRKSLASVWPPGKASGMSTARVCAEHPPEASCSSAGAAAAAEEEAEEEETALEPE